MRNIDILRKMSNEELFKIIESEKICDKTTDEECWQYSDCVYCIIARTKNEYKDCDNNG